ncbi:MAG: arsenate reductase ArsC [Candidatus Ranarchaeia archaeon]
MFIVFACIENSCRSQIAESFFNSLTPNKEWIAISAGTRPAKGINPNTIIVMNEVSIDLSNSKPKLFTKDLNEKADQIITMGCNIKEECPFIPGQSIDWEVQDPNGQSLDVFRKVRDSIHQKVLQLIDNLLKNIE